jgi:flagellar basal-body rod modification protein FlgD
MSDTVGALGGISSYLNNNSSDALTNANLGKEDFLNLLVTQMQHQDPLDPLKNEDFVAQMAQFSSLEQLINVNSTLEQVQLLGSSMNNAQAVSLIGKSLTVIGNTMQIQDGTAGSIDYALYDDAAKVTIMVYDEDGTLVRTINAGAMDAGEQSYEFDGNDNDGNTLEDGTYTFEVSAKDEDGESVDVLTMSTVVIDAVTFDNGSVWLLSGDSKFSLSDVIEVRRGAESTEEPDPEE